MRKIIILLMSLMSWTVTLYGQPRRENKGANTYNTKSLRDKSDFCFSKVYCPVCGKCLYAEFPPNKHGNENEKYWTFDYVCKEHGKVVSIPFYENPPYLKTPDKRYKKRTNANKINSKYSVHEVKNNCYRKDSIKTDDGVIYTITNLCKNTLYFYIESLNICCILNHQKTSSPIKTNPPIILKLTHNEKVWQNWVPSGTRVIE